MIFNKLILNIIKKYNSFILNSKSYSQSSIILFLFSIFDKEITEDTATVIKYAIGVNTASLIIFISLINIFGGLIALNLIDKYNLNEKFRKYPRLLKILNYYKKSSIVGIAIEIALVFALIIMLFIASLLVIGMPFIVK